MKTKREIEEGSSNREREREYSRGQLCVVRSFATTDLNPLSTCLYSLQSLPSSFVFNLSLFSLLKVKVNLFSKC